MVDKVVTKIVLKGDTKDATASFAKFEQRTESAFKNISNRAKKLSENFELATYEAKKFKITAEHMNAVAIAGGAAWAIFANELKKGVASNIENIRTNELLARALADSGHEVERNRLALNARSAQLEKMAGVSDETIRGMQALALNMGVGTLEVDKFITASLRMAKATGKDARESLIQLTKSLSGTAGELSETSKEIKAMSAEELKAGKAADFLNKKWASQLDLADNLPDKITGVGNAYDSMFEAMTESASKSGIVVEALTEIEEALIGIGDAFSQRGMLQGLATIMLGSGGADLADLFIDLNPALAPLFGGGGGATDAGKLTGAAGGEARASFDALIDALMKKAKEEGEKKKSSSQEEATDRGGAADEGYDPSGFEREVAEAKRDRLAEVEAFEAEYTRIVESNEAQRVAITEKAETLKMQHFQDRLTYQIELTNKMADESISATKDQLDTYAQIVDVATSMMTDAITAFSDGSEEAIIRFFLKYARQLGVWMIQDGTANILEGAAINAKVPGAGVPLMVAGAAEVAFGTTLSVGSAVASTVMATSASSSDGSTAGSTATPDALANVRAADGGGAPITVVVYGEPNARTGKFIQKAIAEANARGV